jgi:hypothetical protein
VFRLTDDDDDYDDADDGDSDDAFLFFVRMDPEAKYKLITI